MIEETLFRDFQAEIETMKGVSPVIIFTYVSNTINMLKVKTPGFEILNSRDKLKRIIDLIFAEMVNEETRKQILNQTMGMAIAISLATRGENGHPDFRRAAAEELLRVSLHTE